MENKQAHFNYCPIITDPEIDLDELFNTNYYPESRKGNIERIINIKSQLIHGGKIEK